MQIKFDAMENNENVNIAILTAMEIIAKVCGNVTPTIISSYVNMSYLGITQFAETTELFVPNKEEIEVGIRGTWNLLPEVCKETTFNDFVHFDDGLAVFETQTQKF